MSSLLNLELASDHSFVSLAYQFAQKCHATQVRKYTGVPYFTHCVAVADIVAGVCWRPQLIAAALLHDVVEDVPYATVEAVAKDFLGSMSIGPHVDFRQEGSAKSENESKLEIIFGIFGTEVYNLVESLTDVSTLESGNRALRKEIDCQHIAKGTPDAKTIKLADLIDNAQDIERNDPDFARVYMRETELLLQVLTEGNDYLWHWLKRIILTYQHKNRS